MTNALEHNNSAPPAPDTGPPNASRSKRQLIQLFVIILFVAIPPALAMIFSSVIALIAIIVMTTGLMFTAPGRRALTQIRGFARVTFMENHRRYLMYGAFPLSWIPGLLAAYAADADGTLVGRALLIQHWFTVSATAVGSILTVLIASQAMPADFDSKRIFGVLTKPVPRWRVVAGKWLGLQLYIGLFLAAAYIMTLIFTGMTAFRRLPVDPDTGKPLYYLDNKLGESVFSARRDIPVIYCGINPTRRMNVPIGSPVTMPVRLNGVRQRNAKIIFYIVAPAAETIGKRVDAKFESPGGFTGDGQAQFDDTGRAVIAVNVDPNADFGKIRNTYRPLTITVTSDDETVQAGGESGISWILASVAGSVAANPESEKTWADMINRDGDTPEAVLKNIGLQQAGISSQTTWLVDDTVLKSFPDGEPIAFRVKLVAMRGMTSSYQVDYRLAKLTALPGGNRSPDAIRAMRYQRPDPDRSLAVKSRESYLVIADTPDDTDTNKAPFILQLWPGDPMESLGYMPGDGVSAAPKSQPWAWNVMAAYLIIWLELATLAAIVVLWGGAVSFPVAMTLGMVMALGGQISGLAVKMVDEQIKGRAARAASRERIIKNRKHDLRTARKRLPALTAEYRKRLMELKRKPGMTIDLIYNDPAFNRLMRELNKLNELIDSYPDPDDPNQADIRFLSQGEKRFYQPFPPSQRKYLQVLRTICSVPPDFRRFDARRDLSQYRSVPVSKIAGAFIFMFWLQAGILGGIGMFLYYQREPAAG